MEPKDVKIEGVELKDEPADDTTETLFEPSPEVILAICSHVMSTSTFTKPCRMQKPVSRVPAWCR